MIYIEIVAVIFSLLSVWFAVKKDKLVWPTGIIGIGAYLWLFYAVQLYADFGLQFVYLAQSFYGWWYWSGKKEHIEPPITQLSLGDRVLFIMATVILTSLFNVLLTNFTNASLPFLDSLCSVISLFANWLLARKKLENWYLWIFVDVLYVGVFAYKGLYLSMGLYALFFFMAIAGYKEWKKGVTV